MENNGTTKDLLSRIEELNKQYNINPKEALDQSRELAV